MATYPLHEPPGRRDCQAAVKGPQDDDIQSQALQDGYFFAGCGQVARRALRDQHPRRVGVEGDQGRQAIGLAGAVHHRADEILMAEMHAVKGPDGQDGGLLQVKPREIVNHVHGTFRHTCPLSLLCSPALGQIWAGAKTFLGRQRLASLS